jgi:hypothetical protein
LIGERNITRLAAFRTVVQAVNGKSNVRLPFADGAILLTSTVFFRFVTLPTNYLLTIGCHYASAQDFT